MLPYSWKLCQYKTGMRKKDCGERSLRDSDLTVTTGMVAGKKSLAVTKTV
jgi:hypothetical protein